MKLYRDLRAGETLQAGDERLCPVSLLWSAIAETALGWQVSESAPLYRRPVDVVPREEFVEERTEHARTRHGRDTMRAELDAARDAIQCLRAQIDNDRTAYRAAVATLQSQPRLQPVTPEAIKELQSREAWVILFRHREAQWNRYARATYVPLGRCWFNGGGNEIDPLDFCWFIDPSAIPEVQQ